MFWEIYDNEPIVGPHCDGATHPITDPSLLRGFWLLLPNGTKTWGYEYLNSLYSIG
jgi:hypothetical protein